MNLLDRDRLSYSLDEAAQALGVHKSTVEREVRAGKIPSHKVRGRRVIPKAALEARLKEAN